MDFSGCSALNGVNPDQEKETNGVPSMENIQEK